MNPTLLISDKIIVNKMHSNPQIGEVLVFENNQIKMCKRLVAKSGDKVEYSFNNIFVNGKALRMNEISNYDSFLESAHKTLYLSNDELFLIGDNYNNSIDSRKFGAVKQEKVIGKAIIIYYSNEDKANRIGKRIE